MSIMIGLLCCIATDALNSPTDSLWKKADQAEKEGLPQTALRYYQKIYPIELKSRNWPDALRALTRQIIHQSIIEGNRSEIRIRELETHITTAPAELKPMLQCILAEWYWQFYQQNRWRFMNRSQTQSIMDEDIMTWDLARITGRIDHLYQEVLQFSDTLRTIPIQVYDRFLEKGDIPDTYRPSLYDFIAFQAIEFYTSAEQEAQRPEEPFELDANSDAMARAEQFMRYHPITNDSLSPLYKAFRILQNLLQFHQDDSPNDVFLDADLQRLQLMKNQTWGENKTERYIQRLKEIAEEHPQSELSSLARYYWAREYMNQGDYRHADEVARMGSLSHPKSRGGINCQALQEEIRQKEYDVQSEKIVPPNRPFRLTIQYRNIDKLHIRLYPVTRKESFDQDGNFRMEWIPEEELAKILKQTPYLSLTVGLTPGDSFLTQIHHLEMDGLKPGLYRIFLSYQSDFSLKKNQIKSVVIQVSSMAMIHQQGMNQHQGYIVHSLEGYPLSGIPIRYIQYDYSNKVYQVVDSLTTDSMGYFKLKSTQAHFSGMIIVGDPDADGFIQNNVYQYSHTPSQPQSFRKTLFYTDRAIYRPGQLIHFKGICVEVDPHHQRYEVIPFQPVVVFFLDANQQELGRQELVSNDYGSLAGVWTAPISGLTGTMSIGCSAPEGRASVQVEEYKRPSFEIRLTLPEKEYRLNDTVTIHGQAMTYSGAPLDQSQIKYRVSRQARYPYWYGGDYGDYLRGRHYPGAQAQEIQHGTLRCDSTGTFTIDFPAWPDKQITPSSQPVFIYQVQVDVTDATGETRSQDIQLCIGYTGIEISLKTETWLTEDQPIPIRLTCGNLNGKPLPVKGQIRFYRLTQPTRPIPADWVSGYRPFDNRSESVTGIQSNWNTWELAELVKTMSFETETGHGAWETQLKLPQGIYRAIAVTHDATGQEIKSELTFPVIEPRRKRFPIMIPFYTAVDREVYQPGQTLQMIWGTGYERGPALVEVLRDNQYLQRRWIPAEETQAVLQIPIQEEWRGGITLVVTQVKANRCYQAIKKIDIPWKNKEIHVKWKRFRSALQPGSQETWEIEIQGLKARKKTAELVATLYDESLEQFLPHSFPGFAGLFARDLTGISLQFSNQLQSFMTYQDSFNPGIYYQEGHYRDFPSDIRSPLYGYGYLSRKSMAINESTKAEENFSADLPPSAVPPTPAAGQGMVMDQTTAVPALAVSPSVPRANSGSSLAIRKNLRETAFFFPQIDSDTSGTALIRFQVPEALTRWRLMGFAHTIDMESGYLEDQTVTQKELMVQPLIPRFFRQGDSLEITVKISNLTDSLLLADLQLNFFHPLTDQSADTSVMNFRPNQTIQIPARQSRTLAWGIRVPTGIDLLGYRAIGTAGTNSDGEEGIASVLSQQILVQESMPIWLSKPGQREFLFAKLLQSGQDSGLIHQKLVAQVAVNPAWYAVLALPYLMEFPYECSEQIFNRLFANTLGDKIVSSDPKIKKMINEWKKNGMPPSALESNQDLKSLCLEETPWVRQAAAGVQSHQRLALYLDESYLRYEQEKNLSKLARMQLDNGAFPWFPGGMENDGITLYILTGLGRLRQMGCNLAVKSIEDKSIRYLDQWIIEQYQYYQKNRKKEYDGLTPYIAMYLYGRSFYLKDHPLTGRTAEVVNAYQRQAEKYWLQQNSRMNQAQLAVALHRLGRPIQARAILRSLWERSIMDEELGRYWRDLEISWWWYRAPIETQAMMIEAFHEITHDTVSVNECQIWLLKQKQTQDWRTTKATSDAIYSLLLRNGDWLTIDTTITLKLGSIEIKPDQTQTGIPFIEKEFNPLSIQPEMGKIVISKSNSGIIWGGIHWQYLQNMDHITPHTQNPLKLKKSLTLRHYTNRGPEVVPIPEILQPGDQIMVRIELQSDRDMEYIHLKDYRGSGTEPINVISQYKYQDGLRYYESTRDAATHFFIDYLPKGTYVFEYPIRIAQAGDYTNGISTVECMYAPEFNAHSQAIRLKVKR